jgi:predicted aspartyl protease
LVVNLVFIFFLLRGKLSSIAKEDSEFYLADEADDRPRARFTIVNDYLEPPIKTEIYALIDSGAQSDLILPASLVKELQLQPTGKVSNATGSTNAKATKQHFKPVKLIAVFLRGEVEEEREGYLDVGVFSDTEADVRSLPLNESSSANKKQRRESRASANSVIATVPLTEHRPASKPGQRVILGAGALKKLKFHVNVVGRCLEIEEERWDEDD